MVSYTHPQPSWWNRIRNSGGRRSCNNQGTIKSGIDPASIRAIAVSCQSPCALLVDKNGTPLHNTDLDGQEKY